MASINESKTTLRTNDSLATILAIGTANPSTAIYQTDFPDYYFRVTNNEHMVDLKADFKRLCENSMVKKRYMYLSEKILKENPNLCDYNAPSLRTRQLIQAREIPNMGKQAAIKAIEEWGQPKSKITHLIFCTNSSTDIPGPDYHLIKLLGLNSSVKRYMLPLQGCQAGGGGLRLAKDLAENNHEARVLVVCSDNNVMYFHGPSNKARHESMAGQALFGDGAGAVIVGANPNKNFNERPIFQLVSTTQAILPESEGALEGHLHESGLAPRITTSLPKLVSNNIDNTLVEAFKFLGISEWNSIFWICHPGTASIIAKVESKLGLKESKLSTSKHVLSEFGNMSTATVLFVMDEMRKRSLKEGKATTGDGFDWGVLFGFGPGFTIETIVLHSFPL